MLFEKEYDIICAFVCLLEQVSCFDTCPDIHKANVTRTSTQIPQNKDRHLFPIFQKLIGNSNMCFTLLHVCVNPLFVGP